LVGHAVVPSSDIIGRVDQHHDVEGRVERFAHDPLTLPIAVSHQELNGTRNLAPYRQKLAERVTGGNDLVAGHPEPASKTGRGFNTPDGGFEPALAIARLLQNVDKASTVIGPSELTRRGINRCPELARQLRYALDLEIKIGRQRLLGIALKQDVASEVIRLAFELVGDVGMKSLHAAWKKRNIFRWVGNS
jgi:hypothetical protein